MLATDGSGPWELEEFDEFLFSRDIQLYEMPSPTITGLILGANGWSEIDLAKQIYNKDLTSLRIYTQ